MSDWIQPTSLGNWTYISSWQFSVAGNLTAGFVAGSLVKWAEAGVLKYGVVSASTYGSGITTVTLVSTTDYEMTTNPDALSMGAVPAGDFPPLDFPSSFTWSGIGLRGFSSSSVALARFSVKGRRVTVTFNVGGTSNAATFTITGLPIPLSSIDVECASVAALNNSAIPTYDAVAQIAAGSTVITLAELTYIGVVANQWTTSNIKGAIGQIEYGI